MQETLVATLVKHYGPHAFSLLMFLAIWFTAVKPELDRKSFEENEIRQIVSQMNILASTMERTADTLERIALLRDPEK